MSLFSQLMPLARSMCSRGGGNVLVEVKASGVLMVNAMKCFARAFHLTCQVGALLLRRVIHQSPRALVAGGLFLRTGQGF